MTQVAVHGRLRKRRSRCHPSKFISRVVSDLYIEIKFYAVESQDLDECIVPRSICTSSRVGTRLSALT